MSDFPATGVSPPVIGAWSPLSAGSALYFLINSGAAGSSAAWPAANRGLFVPIWLPGPFKLSAFFCQNGATATGNIDMGLYGVDGTLISSKGSTAQAGTSAIQILTLATPILVQAGRYYMAISASSGTATFISRTPTVINLQRMGVLQAASQVPLANAPTFATCASAYLPCFGISQLTTF